MNPSNEAAKEAARRQEEIILRLRNDLKAHRLAIIVGAGVTLNVTADMSGRPLSRITWTGLIENGLDYLVSEGYVDRSNGRTRRAYEALKDPEIDGLLDAANTVSSQMKQHNQFPTWLQSVFGNLYQDVRHPDLLEALKKLHQDGAILLTTNYDDVLETHCGLRHIGRSKAEDILKFRRGHLDGVFHIHGSFHDPQEVVLDTTDYYKIRTSDELQSMLEAFMDDKTILFVGCGSGLEDPNFDRLLKWANERQKNLPNHHCLLIRNDDSVNYQPLVRVKYGPRYEDLVIYLKRLLDDETKIQRPSAIGLDSRTHTDYQIGIICALATEKAAMVAMLDETHPKLKKQYGDENEYTLGRIGVHNVVIACLPASLLGNGPAAIVANNVQRSFPIKFGLMVGVGSGVWSKKDDIRLGDIVVGQPTGAYGGVAQWDFGKTGKGGRFQRTGSLDKLPPVLLHALQELKTFDLTEGVDIEGPLSLIVQNKPRMGQTYRYQGADHDRLFEAAYDHEGNETCDGCDPKLIVQRLAREGSTPRIHYGKIASGNEVIKHGTTRDERAKEEGVICFEVEAAGLMVNFQCLMIRGICDYADSHRNKMWQSYAAATAAAFARVLLGFIGEQEVTKTSPEMAFLQVKSAEHVMPLGTETLSTRVFEGHRVLREDILVTRDSLESSLMAQRKQLSRIETQSKTHQSRLDNVEQLLKDLCIVSSLPGNQSRSKVQMNLGEMAGRLLAKPTNLKRACDELGVQMEASLTEREYIRPIQIESLVEARFICSCRPVRRRTRKNVLWGQFDLYYETSTKEHSPDCKASRIIANQQHRTVGLGYIGMNNFLKSAIKISFAMTSGAGGWSISPTFTYFPTVDGTEPAFRVLGLMESVISISYEGEDEGSLDSVQWKNFVASALAKILRLFQVRRASPLAVDSENRSLNHHLADLIFYASRKGDDFANPLLEALKTLVIYGVPPADYDLFGVTPLESVTNPPCQHSLEAAEIILQSNSESIPLVQKIDRLPAWGKDTLFEFLSISGGISEAYGCGPLSLAILKNDLDRVKNLLIQYPRMVNEQNAMGYSPLHLAAGSPLCLKFLVKAVDHTLLNRRCFSGWSPLETAMILSSARCRNGTSHRKCSRCSCADCVVILLKADCAIPSPLHYSGLHSVLRYASERCKRRYICHMRDRRERLKRLAFDRLPAIEVKGLKLRDEDVLDFHAPQVVKVLRERNIHIPDALAIHAVGTEHFKLVYQDLPSPHDADLFFRKGFRDTDPVQDGHRHPLAMYGTISGDRTPHLHWLVDHGADLFRLLNPRSHSSGLHPQNNVFTAHYTFQIIGVDLFYNYYYGYIDVGVKSSTKALNAMVLPVELSDNCRCSCSVGGCSPLLYMLEGICRKNRGSDRELSPHGIAHIFSWYLEHFGEDLSTTDHATAIRFLTFRALGIVHTCCGQKLVDGSHSVQEDIDEVWEEEKFVLEKLEELVIEFQNEALGNIEDAPCQSHRLAHFWTGYWVDRIKEVLAELDMREISEDQRQGAEEIGVIWGDSNSNPEDTPHMDTVDELIKALDKILVD